MRMNISAWSIRTPIPSIVLFVVLTLLGIVSFFRLPITKFPNIDVPFVSVTVTQQGAAPSELETQVTKIIEDAVAGLTGVKHITSTVTDGSSLSMIEFQLETDTERAINDVKDAISRIRVELPSSIDEPIVSRIDIEGLPIVTYGIIAPAMTPEELSWFVDDRLSRALQSVKGVAKVSRIGGVDREIQVSLNAARLSALGITAAEVNDQVRATAIDLAGGKGELGNAEQSIRTLGGAKSADELGKLMISVPGNRKVRLEEVATITDGWKEPTQFASLDGRQVVGLQVYRGKGQSDTSVEKAVSRKVEELRKQFPDVSMTVIDNAVTYTYGNFESAMHTLLEGALLAVLVVFIFLKDKRATLITAIALPLSILPTFWVMMMLGFSLNLVSLLAITLATGILVDDAIVEIENIIRHMRTGKSPYKASLEAADEIGLAVIAISFTIIAVFMPVSFMGGIAGQYFRQFGMTVAVAVMFSLLVARLITPMLAAYFLRPHDEKDRHDGELMTLYTRFVLWSVRHRIKTVMAGLLLFVCSVMSMGFLPSGFLPVEDQSRSLLAVELPPGSRIEDTQAATDGIAAYLKKMPEVKSVFVSGGGILGGGSEVRKATLIVNYVPKGEREYSQRQLEQRIAADIVQRPDMRIWFSNENGQRAFTMIVSGPSSEAVEKTALGIYNEMKNVKVLANVVSSAALARPEIRIHPKADLAATLGVNTQALSQTIRVATIGDIDAILTKLNIGDRQVPVRVQLDTQARTSLDTLSNLRVPTASGAAVPLSTVADIRFGQGPSIVDRYDRQRQVKLEGDLVGTDALGDALKQVYALPAAQNLKDGVTLKESGDAEVMAEIFTSFGLAMGAGIMMVYGVLVLLFHSFLLPITILFSLPLSIGGAIIALLVTHNSVSMPVVIGILMLMGIVTKNAIMLADFAVERMAEGVERTEALVDAGRKRARPIIMTTIAMAAGMIPSAMAIGEGGEFRAPMAIAVIGGLIVSTFLSLLFVPAMFTLVDDMGAKIYRIFAPMIGPKDE